MGNTKHFSFFLHVCVCLCLFSEYVKVCWRGRWWSLLLFSEVDATLCCGTEPASNLRLRACVCWNWGQRLAFYLKIHWKLQRADKGFRGTWWQADTRAGSLTSGTGNKGQLGSAETKALGLDNTETLWDLENTNSQRKHFFISGCFLCL